MARKKKIISPVIEAKKPIEKPIEEPIKEIKVEKPIEENPIEKPVEIKEVGLNESQSLQKQGWYVFDMQQINGKMIHKLKKREELEKKSHGEKR